MSNSLLVIELIRQVALEKSLYRFSNNKKENHFTFFLLSLKWKLILMLKHLVILMVIATLTIFNIPRLLLFLWQK